MLRTFAVTIAFLLSLPLQPQTNAEPDPDALRAIETNDMPLLRTRLAAGINVNAQATKKPALLFVAASKVNKEAVKLLLAAKADPNLEPRAIDPANFSKDDELVEMLILGGTKLNGTGVIHNVAMVPFLTQVLVIYFRHGANPNDLRPNGETPLHAACDKIKAADNALFLIEKKAAANARDTLGQTPLHKLASPGLSIKKLQEDNAKAQLIILPALIKAGADVNSVDKLGDTPMHIAARNKDLAFAKALIAAGANPNLENAAGQSPRDIAPTIVP